MKKQHWRDWGVLLLGAWIFVTPWIMPHSMAAEVPGSAGTLAVFDLWVVGAAVALIAAAAILVFNAWYEWLNLALGAWLVVSPWALGFNAEPALTWNAVVAGALVVLFAGWTLVAEQGRAQQRSKSRPHGA